MADETKISWADHTHNHWIGCAKVSPACDGCYAAHLMDTRLGRVEWGGPGKGQGTRALTSAANRRKPLTWDRNAAKAGNRPFVFCSSLADVFDNQVPAEWRADLFDLIRRTPNLVWLLLTKRPQNIVKLFREALSIEGGAEYVAEQWPRNAAIGTTVEDQVRFDQNVPALRKMKRLLDPAFAFLSCEPLLEPLSGSFHEIDWVITGGETDQGAHKARPTNPNWFRRIRDQCASAGVHYHHKQNGEFVSISDTDPEGRFFLDYKGDLFTFPNALTVRKVGKHRSGRAIDGVEHNAFPQVRRMA